jgi:hypothetical protein
MRQPSERARFVNPYWEGYLEIAKALLETLAILAHDELPKVAAPTHVGRLIVHHKDPFIGA